MWAGNSSRATASVTRRSDPLLHAKQPGDGDGGLLVRHGGVTVCHFDRCRSPPLLLRRHAHGHADAGGLLFSDVQKGRECRSF